MNDYHVLPINDAIAHDETRGCWCQPWCEQIFEEDWRTATLVVHRSADGRELSEDDAEVPPATRH